MKFEIGTFMFTSVLLCIMYVWHLQVFESHFLIFIDSYEPTDPPRV